MHCNDRCEMCHIFFVSNSAWNIAHFRMPVLEVLLQNGFRITVAAPADGYEQTLRDRGIEFLPLAMNPSGKNPVSDVLLTIRMWAIFRKVRPDAILTFTIKPNLYGAVAARLVGIPVIPTISGLGSAFLSGGMLARLSKAMFRVALRSSRAVFFQNRDDRDLFVRLGLVKQNLTRLVPGSGIDLRRFQPTSLPKKGIFTFLQIGRVIADKGVYELIEASRLLRSRKVAARIILLGEVGANNPSAISSAEVTSWVEEGLVEHVPPVRDVRHWIEKAHAVVLPSYREGLPRSLLEGAAMARPLLATDVPGCREVVVDGLNGRLFLPKSAVSLADALQNMLQQNGDELDRMAQESRALAERKFDQRLVAKAYLEELSA